MEYKRNDWRKTNLEFIAPENGDLMTREQFLRYLKKTEVSGDFTKEVGDTLFYYNSAKCLLAKHNDITDEVNFY